MKGLSLCMVTAGDNKQLERCLNSAQNLVDEIIVVNMEPTDRIQKLCQSYGAKVFDFYRDGSYAEAGNYALEQATGDWILWMHGDEQLDGSDRFRIRDLLYMEQYDLIFLHLLQYGTTSTGRLRILDMACPRLFRRGIKFQYFSASHEVLNYSQLGSKSGEQERVGIFPLKIHDYRLENAPVKNKSKQLSELDQLGRQLQAESDTGHWYAYHLACEYYRLQVYRPGLKYLNIAIQHYLDMKDLPPSVVYKLKYSVVLDEANSEEINRGLKLALRMYPDYVDLQFYSGILHYRLKMYEEAIHYFNRCLELGEPQYGDYLVRKGAGSYQAAYYKGLCLDKLGQIDTALSSYVESIANNNTYRPPLEALMKRMESDIDYKELAYFWKDDTPISMGNMQNLINAQRKASILAKI
jgi:glycosyltransferase involved in cell wall biosynthesis